MKFRDLLFCALLSVIALNTCFLAYETYFQTHMAELSIAQIFRATGQQPIPERRPRTDLPPNWPTAPREF